MASKKRGGLSKREYASQTKAKVTTKSNRTTASKSVAPLVGAGPLLPGQVRVGGTVQGAGPLLPNQTRDNSYTGGSSQREKASKASKSKSKSASVPGLTGGRSFAPVSSTVDLNAATKSGGLVKGGGSRGLPVKSPSLIDRFLKNLGGGGSLGAGGSELANPLYDSGRSRVADTVGKMSSDAAKDTFGVPNVYASAFSDIGNTQEDTPFSPGGSLVRDNGMYSTPGDYTPSNPSYTPFSVPGDTDQASALDNAIFGGKKNNDNSDNYSRPGDKEQANYLDQLVSQSQTNNDLYGNNEQAPADLPGKTTRQTYGSGAFGTGKGVMSDDPYIKELRKAYSSNGGEKWLRKQFEELIAALDPTYAQMQKEGTDALNAQLWNNNTQLASVMNANNTGDSEQRAQLMAGQQRDTSTALGNLLAKLSQSKAQDISGYKSEQAKQMGQLQEKNQTNQQRLLEQIQQYQQQRLQNSRSSAGSGGASKNQAAIQALLNRAANMPSGGREYAAQIAKIQGLGDISGYTPNGWENAYNPSFGQATPPAYSASGEVRKIMDALGVDADTAQKLIMQESE